MNIPPNKTLIINADDFAQSAPIDAAIIELAQRGIIQGTSALVLSPRWKTSAKILANLPIQAGLHLDLTSHFTQQFDCYHPLPRLIAAAYMGRLNTQHLEKAIEVQWDRFSQELGREPDFIDGHQHVHQLPIVRDALFLVIAKKSWGQESKNWLRICHANHWRGFKAQLISTLGAKKTQRIANEHGIRTNSDFTGVYDFDSPKHLNALWQTWLKNLNGDFPVIMCHVAKIQHPNPANETDPIYKARLREYDWLSSPDFNALLESNGYTR